MDCALHSLSTGNIITITLYPSKSATIHPNRKKPLSSTVKKKLSSGEKARGLKRFVVAMALVSFKNVPASNSPNFQFYPGLDNLLPPHTHTFSNCSQFSPQADKAYQPLLYKHLACVALALHRYAPLYSSTGSTLCSWARDSLLNRPSD